MSNYTELANVLASVSMQLDTLTEENHKLKRKLTKSKKAFKDVSEDYNMICEKYNTVWKENQIRKQGYDRLETDLSNANGAYDVLDEENRKLKNLLAYGLHPNYRHLITDQELTGELHGEYSLLDCTGICKILKNELCEKSKIAKGKKSIKVKKNPKAKKTTKHSDKASRTSRPIKFSM